MRSLKVMAAAVGLAAVVSVVGCCPGTPVAGPPTEPSPAASVTIAARVSVGPDGFVPRAVTVKAGDAVTWTNEDRVKHNVGGSGLVSGVLDPGGSYTHVFAAEGTYQYLCTFHPETEEGMVVVEPR